MPATLNRLVIHLGVLSVAGIGACGREPVQEQLAATVAAPAGRDFTVRDTTIAAVIDAAGIALPVQQATLSTKLMGSITEVRVQEGERVRKGQVLARIDARDINARRSQSSAAIAEAEAVQRDALTQARRFRALFADSAASRAQLDAVETGLARAEAGARSAHAAAGEVAAMGSYAEIRAPFDGMVTKRFVDPGAFVAPGAPVASVQDGTRLRIAVTVTPATGMALRSGMHVAATVERAPVDAVIEGVAPAASGAVYTVNALVANARGALPSGGAATLRIPQGVRTAVVIPAAALVREGELTGVRVRTPTGLDLRWVRLGVAADGMVEVLSGLRSGDVVFVPAASEAGS